MKANRPVMIGAIVAASIGVAIFTKEWIQLQSEEEGLASSFQDSPLEDADGGNGDLVDALEELDDGSEMHEQDPRARFLADADEIESGEDGERVVHEMEALEEDEELETVEIDEEKPPGEDSEIGDIARSSLIAAKILSDQRFLDPFGMAMDPANRAEVASLAENYEETEETPTLNNSALRNALGRLPITGVYPGRQVVVVGPRAFERGQQIGLRAEGITLRLRFEGIYNRLVYFRDMETNEVTSVEFNPLPPEFEPIRPGSKREPGEGIHAMNSLFIAN